MRQGKAKVGVYMAKKMRKTRAKKVIKNEIQKEIEQLLNSARITASRIERLKVHYQDLEYVTDRLQMLGFKYDLKSGIRLKDNFKTKNVVYRTTSVKRFELEFDDV